MTTIVFLMLKTSFGLKSLNMVSDLKDYIF